MSGAELLRDFDPAHARQAQVDQDQIRLRGNGALVSAFAIGGKQRLPGSVELRNLNCVGLVGFGDVP